VAARLDEDLLAAVIDEVIYWLDSGRDPGLGGGAPGAAWRGRGVSDAGPHG